jgi:hypothetical protein
MIGNDCKAKQHLSLRATDDAISGSAYDDDANLLSARIIVFAAHHCAELQCGARQNKSLLIIAGFNHHDNDGDK